MKTILTLLVLTLAASAADITVIIRNDAGTVVSTTTMKTTNPVLQTINQWRLAQVLTPEQPGCSSCTPPLPATPAVLKFPDASAFWRHMVRETVKPILTEYHAAVIAERGKIDAAQAAVEKLKETAVQ